MTKKINVFVPEDNQLTKKVIDYFVKFDFTLVEQNDNCLKFKHESTLFDPWKTNPLKWGSEISVLINNNTIVAEFCIDTEAQMNTKEEDTVWNTFIENFQSYMTKGMDANPKLNSTIADNRRIRKGYIIWAFVGAVTGGLLNIIYNRLTNNNSILGLFLIPIMATLFLTWRINYKRSKKPPYFNDK